MLGTTRPIKIAHFILLAYTDLFNKRGYDMVGTTDNSNNLIVYSYDFKSEDFEVTFEYKHDSPIHIVIPSNFDGKKQGSLLLVTKETDGTFKNSVLFTEDKQIIPLPDTIAAPMLYTQNETLKPALLMQLSTKLISVDFDPDRSLNKKELTGFLKEGEKLHKNHTSSFVDLNGDHKADMALVVEKEHGKFLKVFSNTKDKFTILFEMPLPESTGPLIFNDLKKHNMNDLAFISKENGNYYLNVYFNTNSRKASKDSKSLKNGFEFGENEYIEEIYRKDGPNIKQNLANLSGLPGELISCKIECQSLGQIPYGIFDTDIDLDKSIELFVIGDIKSKGDTIIPLKFNNSKEVYEVYEELDFLMHESGVVSFSTVDFSNEGRELCVINKIQNSVPVVVILPEVLRPENMKLSVTTVRDDTKTLYGHGIAGTSYLLSYDEDTNISIGYSSPPGPFLHLKNQTFTFGLGSTILHINSLRLTVPSFGDYEKTYTIKYDIIQNFDLIVGAQKNGVYNIRAFILASRYLFKILITLATVIILNCIIVLILHFRHAKKKREARNKDSMHPLFRSLG